MTQLLVKKIENAESPLFSKDLMQLYQPPVSGAPYTGDHLTFDTKKADEILLHMLTWFTEGKGHYQHNNVENAPQNSLMPGMYREWNPQQISLHDDTLDERHAVRPLKRGSLKHLQWLFPSVGSDRRQESFLVYRNHSRLYYAHPELYHGKAQYMSQPKLEKLLRQFGFGIPDQTSLYWPYQCRTLFTYFGGNPIEMLNHCGGTVAGVLKFKKDQEKRELEKNLFPHLVLPGFGPKITSLMYLFFEELGVFPMPDDAFAVDIHVQRFFMQIGSLITSKTVSAGVLERILRPYLCGFAKRFNVSKVDVAHALWQNGAKMCDVCTRQKGAAELCSVEKFCTGPIDTSSYQAKSQWQYPLVFRPKYGCRQFSMPVSPLFADKAA